MARDRDSRLRCSRSGPELAPELDSPVRAALKQQAYPWYDSESDGVKPLLPDPSTWSVWIGKRVDSFFDWLGHLFGQRRGLSTPGSSGLGSALATLLFIAAGVLFFWLLWRFWRLGAGPEPEATEPAVRIGDAVRAAGLPASMAAEGIDPWAEALRRRADGDLAGAVVWLFLDQLVGLQRVGLVRLMPGRTARQYAGGLDDTLLRNSLRATLQVFEDVYYGHRRPDRDEFERVWASAEAFRRRLQTIQVS